VTGADDAAAKAAQAKLVRVGETFSETLKYTRDEIVAFASLTHDDNPLHHDRQAAQRSQFGEIIASGQHTAALLMGILATYFSRQDDGVRREMVCLNFNVSFKEPLFAEQQIDLSWKVAAVQWNGKLGGMVAHVDGMASPPHHRPAVIARGTILVRLAA
jgi:acyl dehydratase